MGNLLVRTYQGHSGQVNSVAFSPDGKYLATGSNDKTTKLWDVKTGKCVRTLEGHSRVRSVTFSPDSRRLATGCDSKARLWDVETGACVRTLQEQTTGVVKVVAFSNDGAYVATAESGDKTVKLFDVKTSACVLILQGHTRRITLVAFLSDGLFVATGSEDVTAKLWDVKTGACVHTLEGHSGILYPLAFSPRGLYFATGSRDNLAKLWNVKTGDCVHELRGHAGWVRAATFSPDGLYFATGSMDNAVKIWYVETGSCVRTLNGHASWINSLAFSPDGRSLATGSWDETTKLWDLSAIKSGPVAMSISPVNALPDALWDTVVRPANVQMAAMVPTCALPACASGDVSGPAPAFGDAETTFADLKKRLNLADDVDVVPVDDDLMDEFQGLFKIDFKELKRGMEDTCRRLLDRRSKGQMKLRHWRIFFNSWSESGKSMPEYLASKMSDKVDEFKLVRR